MESKRQTLRREFIFSIIEHYYTDWVLGRMFRGQGGRLLRRIIFNLVFIFCLRDHNTEVFSVIISEISLDFNDMQFPVFLSKS